MPRVQVETIQQLQDALKEIPLDAVLRVTVEWDAPEPICDWTPEMVADYFVSEWLGISPDCPAGSVYKIAISLANRIFELEKEACAGEITKAIDFFESGGDMHLVGLLQGIRQNILDRSNDQAGYPRIVG